MDQMIHKQSSYMGAKCDIYFSELWILCWFLIAIAQPLLYIIKGVYNRREIRQLKFSPKCQKSKTRHPTI